MPERRRPPQDRRPPRDEYHGEQRYNERSYSRQEYREERYYDERFPESYRHSPYAPSRENEPRGHTPRRPNPRRGGFHRNAPGHRSEHPQHPLRSRRTPRPPMKKGTMTVSATIVVMLFFGFVIAYMGLQAYGFFSPNVDTMTLRLTNMENQQSVPGMIIRYEEVFHANRDGRIAFDVQEHDRVRAGMVVASIRDTDAVARTEQEMEQLMREVMSVSEMRHATLSAPRVARANATIRNRMDRSMHHHMQGNLTEVYALLDSLTEITDSRNLTIMEESIHLRHDLNRQHYLLTAQTEMNLRNIYATSTGIMSQVIDGFEARFTPYNMHYLSQYDIQLNVNIEASIPGREVYEGDEVFKIIGDNRWYVAAWMSHEMVAGFAEGQERIIFLENTTVGRFEPMPMRIVHFDYQFHDAYVIFRSTRNVAEFLNQRNVNIRISDNVENGFMVPSSAIATRRFFRIPLTHVHGVENYFIMHRRDGVLHPVVINIHEETASYVYVLEDSVMLFPGDSLSPVDPTNTIHFISDRDVRIEHGVYNTTLGYASFRIVHPDGDIPETGNILLCPTRNPSLRQFDSIVIDAAMVREGQVMR